MHNVNLGLFLYTFSFMSRIHFLHLIRLHGRYKSIAIQIGEFIEQLDDNFESVVTSYFEDFKPIKKRLRIAVSLVKKHFDEVCFQINTDFTYVQATIPKVKWLRPLGYEINIDEASAAITSLLVEEVDN